MKANPQIEAMRRLGFSEEEIKSVQAYDAEIDAGKNPLPLTAEQEKASRDARSIGQKTVYNFTQRERKADEPKRALMESFTKCAKSIGEQVKVTNPERELEFIYNGKKYRLTLSAPRK